MSGRFLSKHLVWNMELQQKFKYIICYIPTYHFLAEAEVYCLISLVDIVYTVYTYMILHVWDSFFILSPTVWPNLFCLRLQATAAKPLSLWAQLFLESPLRVWRAKTCFTSNRRIQRMSGQRHDSWGKGNWEPTAVMQAQQESCSNSYSEGLSLVFWRK